MNRFKSEYPRRNTPTGTKVYLNWKGLKENICPKCNKDIAAAMRTIRNGEKYLTHSCGFTIRESRFSQIVTSQVTASLEKELEEENDLLQ